MSYNLGEILPPSPNVNLVNFDVITIIITVLQKVNVTPETPIIL